MMKILVIGNGGREHALVEAIKKSNKAKEIFCLPGNAGTHHVATNINNVDIKKFTEIKKFIKKKKIDLVIVGPEKPLVDGIVDYLEKNKIKVFGPNKRASKLEGSKIFTKKICKNYNIPTAKFKIFKNKIKAYKYIKSSEFPLVIKSDGLASGKGVYICENIKKANKAITDIFNGKFGEAKQILIEELLRGEEMSFFVISDGKTIKKFGTAQDHKKIYEGDKGPNTGGMGAYSPSLLEDKLMDKKILNKIIYPTFKSLKDMKIHFKGFLYAGLMIVKNQPYLIEYNVRMGDPECQTILPRLKTDFLRVISKSVEGKLSNLQIKWKDKKSLCIVLTSKGYPGKFKNNIEIKNLSNYKSKNDQIIFHAGTKIKNDKVFSNGGRVLNFVSLSKSLKKSRKKLLSLIKKINWNNGFYRKDIGFKAIK
jgi:phosphoribosylamine--glycine ligase